MGFYLALIRIKPEARLFRSWMNVSEPVLFVAARPVRNRKHAFAGTQFVAVQTGQLGDQLVPFGRQMDFNVTRIITPGSTFNQSQLFATGNQRNHTVMMRLKTLSQLANIGPLSSGKPLDLKQHLILQAGNSILTRKHFGKAQETPELIAEFSHCLNFRQWK